MIIFDKFGDGQSELNRTVPAFPNNPMRIVTRVSPLRLLALAKEGTKKEAKERHSSRLSERLSRSALVAPSATLTSGRIAVSPRGTRVVGHEPRTPISNRELDLLERHLSHCKQRKATVSNRELSTNHGSCNSQVLAARTGHSALATCRSRDAAEQGKIPLAIRNEKELS